MQIDVCPEAQTIRDALEPHGWNYGGGGPYPFEPVLRFRRADGAKLTVALKVEKALSPKDPD